MKSLHNRKTCIHLFDLQRKKNILSDKPKTSGHNQAKCQYESNNGYHLQNELIGNPMLHDPLLLLFYISLRYTV